MDGFVRRVGFALLAPLAAAGSAPQAAADPPILYGGAVGPGYYSPWFGPWAGGFPPGGTGAYAGPYGAYPGGYGYGPRAGGGSFNIGFSAYNSYPYWGVPPGAAGSFWTNGLTLYGPPVPTYAVTPGSFGGTDAGKLFFRNPPPASGVYVGAAFPLNRGAGPRLPPGPPPVPEPSAPPFTLPPPQDLTRARVAVRVPDPNADVWVDKTVTKMKGTDRVFESPPLTGDGPFRYEVIARWTENGESRAESRVVTAKPGETAVVDFTRPADLP